MLAEELLAAGDHLAVCPACREACREVDFQGSVAALRNEIRAAGPDHLSYEQLEAKVDGRLDEVEREIVASHLEVCPRCASELGDLRRAKAALGARQRFRVLWPLPLAAAVAAVLLVGWFATESLRRPPLPPAYQQMVDRALRTQTVEMPAALAGLRGKAGTLLAGSGEKSFRLLRPVGSVVESERPLFRWEPVAGARSYTVSIFDAAASRVASSGEIQSVEWTPPGPLARGGAYSWQVTARGEGVDLLAPAPPAPEARFQVLEQAGVNEIAAARGKLAGAHLALGLLYARFGLLEDAARELRAVTPAEASPDVVKNLASQVEVASR